MRGLNVHWAESQPQVLYVEMTRSTEETHGSQLHVKLITAPLVSFLRSCIGSRFQIAENPVAEAQCHSYLMSTNTDVEVC